MKPWSRLRVGDPLENQHGYLVYPLITQDGVEICSIEEDKDHAEFIAKACNYYCVLMERQERIDKRLQDKINEENDNG